ncbi:hypothetical protein MM221_06215 [Salipaludibacillus sp. LMS25]|uniref:DUF6792 domain-containing protein n=1 Tax=Salipaludibacillus sp. LMS25 TaxID=2924031 RepID=UPI0020D092B2|nr:DUF6792 domain-containing protein [Salipaludibacillus sp. LMS25]UTR16151.1 hypothetical protein MM221_06215 [Salipaludibacillus sp. LMS25]
MNLKMVINMTNKEVLGSDSVRARIIQMEYKELTESEIRRIYIEETGTEPPANITIYSSDDFPELREGDYYSGFDGSAIHFYDEKKGINQVYTITRGSEGSEKDSWKLKNWFGVEVVGYFLIIKSVKKLTIKTC